MKAFIVSNVKIKNLDSMDFYNNPEYKSIGVHEGTSTLVPFYKELLEEVIGNKVEEIFKDDTLSKEKTIAIQAVFERELEKLIPLIEYGKPPHKRLEWKGNTYDLNLGLPSVNNRQISDYKDIIDICTECLKENKPMYLSID